MNKYSFTLESYNPLETVMNEISKFFPKIQVKEIKEVKVIKARNGTLASMIADYKIYLKQFYFLSNKFTFQEYCKHYHNYFVPDDIPKHYGL